MHTFRGEYIDVRLSVVKAARRNVASNVCTDSAFGPETYDPRTKVCFPRLTLLCLSFTLKTTQYEFSEVPFCSKEFLNRPER